MTFSETIFSVRLKQMSLSDANIGYVFGLGSLLYTVAAPLVGALCRVFKSLYITQVAFLISSICLFMYGPSQILHFPDKLIMVIIGYVLSGAANAFMYVPLLTEMIDAIKEKTDIKIDMSVLNDRASGIFSTSIAFGSIIGPVIGGVLKD